MNALLVRDVYGILINYNCDERTEQGAAIAQDIEEQGDLLQQDTQAGPGRFRLGLPRLRRTRPHSLRLQDHLPREDQRPDQPIVHHQEDQGRNRQHADRTQLAYRTVLPGQNVIKRQYSSDRNIYILCEYCNGDNLDRFLRNRGYLTEF
jgi:hypothetical protein